MLTFDSLTARVLRFLATQHVFRECPPLSSSNPTALDDRFAHSRISVALDSGAPLDEILPPTSNIKEEHEDAFEGVKMRWKAKYGRTEPGASLSAIVGLL